ncbi:PH domain-containing protein [Clostridium swellfunianum]|uniref:PH domain-containing protein n=1 Tax=Clostridium swellfunianum TaxID=1367462 RepID=UPI00202E3644|nr:PH domain-containing protein [Clostridium swellfunianum]MCM0648811.1 PH domain-containing protein [Clostridium swellfunianum]
MIIYKPRRGSGLYHLLGSTILYNALIGIMYFFINSYVLSSLIKLFLIIFNAYQIYYILVFSTLKYGIDNEYIYILNVFRKIKIQISKIEAYQILNEKINGIKLSGFCTNDFALGRSFIKSIGTTSMYVTDNNKIFYLKYGEKNYAVSPEYDEGFAKQLTENRIPIIEWEYKWDKEVSLHKDKSFMMPFFVVTIINIILTLNPFILYLMNKLPDTMPLSFDSSFMPLEIGKGKQFAFSQMVYGALNMSIQFCMYYASHFYAKYDRRLANRFIYVALVIAAAFLLIQFRIVYTFK